MTVTAKDAGAVPWGRGMLVEGSAGPEVVLNKDIYYNTVSVWNRLGIARHTKLSKPITDLSAAAAFLEKDLPLGIRSIYSNTTQQVGSDPEIFACMPSGKVVPAFEFLPAEHAALRAGSYSKAYYDGFQAELSTTTGYGCIAYLIDALQSGLSTIHSTLRAAHPTAELVCKDVVEVSRKTLLTAAQEHVQLGCAPSQNAYGLEPVQVIEPRDLPWRFSGCHTHHNVPTPSAYPVHVPHWFPDGTVVMMDKIVGLCLTALGRGLEDPRRRRFYGRPGEYRLPKRAGLNLEYRVPGAFCMAMPELAHFLYDLARYSFNMGLVADGRSYFLPEAQSIITACDADAAWGVIDKHKEFFSKVFAQCWPGVTSAADRTLSLLRTGIAASPLWEPSVAKAWKLPAGRFDGHTTTFASLLTSVKA